MVRLLFAGIMLGTLYGLVAVTLTLMLRSSGILSFAHAGFALISAYAYRGVVCPNDPGQYRPCGDAIMSPVPAAALAVGLAVVAALLVERFVARPLIGASAATKVVATAAVLALTGGVLLQLFGSLPKVVPSDASRQLLPGGTIEVGSLVIAIPNLVIFVIAVALVTLLGVLLRRSWFGLGVRAAGQLPDVARLMGVSPVATSRFNWALGGLLAGLAGVLIGPITVLTFGTFAFLLVKAVGAVLIGGLVSLPLTFLGGIALGATEAVVPHFWNTTGAPEVAVTCVILAMLLVHRRRLALFGYGAAPQERGPGGRVASSIARVVGGIQEVASTLPRPIRLLAGVAIALAPLGGSYYASVGIVALTYCLLALSVVILTGTTGQVTFMQAGFAAIGAFGLATAFERTGNVLFAVAVGSGAAAAIGAAVGLISLRFRGLEFAIASIAVGAMLSEFVVTRPGVETNVARPELFGRSLLESKTLYLVMLVGTAVVMLLMANVRRSGWGRTLRTMREMHTKVAHFGLAPVGSEVALLTMSAGVAGVAGAFQALTIVSLYPALFNPLVSVTIVLVAVVGGLQSLWGPVIAGLIFGPGQEIIGRVFSSNSANAFPQIASAALAVVLLVGMPNGLASAFRWAGSVRRRHPARDQAPTFRGRAFPGCPHPVAPPPLEATLAGGARRVAFSEGRSQA